MARQDLQAEGTALKALLADVRKKPHNFAILQSSDGVVIQADKKKPTNLLRKAAKNEGGGNRGAWGVMSMEGKTMILTCEEEPPGTLAKLIRKHCSARGQNVQVEIRLDDDGMDVSKDDECDADVEPEDNTDREDTAPSTKSLSNAENDDAVGAEAAQIELTSEENDHAEHPDDPDDEDTIAAHAGDVQRLLVAAKKRAFNCAWMLGKEGVVLKAHRRKPIELLVKLAKSEGAGNRGAWGVMHVEGKVIVVNCEEEPPTALIKASRTFLRSLGLNHRITLRGPENELVIDPEEDSAEDAETDSVESPTGSPEASLASRAAVQKDVSARREVLAEPMRLLRRNLEPIDRKMAQLEPLLQDAVENDDYTRSYRILSLMRAKMLDGAALRPRAIQRRTPRLSRETDQARVERTSLVADPMQNIELDPNFEPTRVLTVTKASSS